jgi:hypothetical protein
MLNPSNDTNIKVCGFKNLSRKVNAGLFFWYNTSAITFNIIVGIYIDDTAASIIRNTISEIAGVEDISTNNF